MTSSVPTLPRESGASGVSVRRARPDDVPRLAAVLSRAFAADPLMRWYVPRQERRVETLERFYRANLEPVLRRCDEGGVPAYVESSSERNLTLYERHGFRVTDAIRVPRGPCVWSLWRASAVRPVDDEGQQS